MGLFRKPKAAQASSVAKQIVAQRFLDSAIENYLENYADSNGVPRAMIGDWMVLVELALPDGGEDPLGSVAVAIINKDLMDCRSRGNLIAKGVEAVRDRHQKECEE